MKLKEAYGDLVVFNGRKAPFVLCSSRDVIAVKNVWVEGTKYQLADDGETLVADVDQSTAGLLIVSRG